MITIASPEIGLEEVSAAKKVLKSGTLAQGPEVSLLEANFANFCGTKYASAVSSGTAALHAALYALGIGPGDEVITTPFSFIATVNSILFQRARPVFVDIDPTTFNIDVKKVEKAITQNTKAIMPVHLYGQPADMRELNDIAKKHGLVVIEDACQAVGANYDNNKTGNLGDIGCFSLYATKNIMSGEGGIITTNNEKWIESIKRFRQHGMSGPYEYEGIGYNYRLTDLQAAIAIEQLKKASSFNNARQLNAELLNKGLQNIQNIVLPFVGNDRSHVYHQYTIRIGKNFPYSRNKLIAKLKERGVGAGVYYPKPLHAYRHIAELGYKLGDFPEAEIAATQVLSLPVHPKLTDKDVDLIVESMKELASGK